jgi:hypothetical protein
VENVSLTILLVLLVLIVREYRAGNRAVKDDPTLSLERSERFRTLRMQLLEPLVALVVVGSLLVTDLGRTPAHLVAALVGGVAGYAFGVYRARATYVSAVPTHRGVVLRYSLESFAALGLLLVIKVVAERNLLPEGAVFGVVLAGLLAFLLVESFARVLALVRRYRADEANAQSAV